MNDVVNIWGDAKKELDKSKNYVGLIPENPRYDGFELMYIKDPFPDGIGGVLDENIYNITLNNSATWSSLASVYTAIDINIPYDVKIWGIYLNGTIARFYTNSNRTRNIELLYRDTELVRIDTQFPCNIIDVGQIFININNATKHKFYRIVFKSNIPIVTSLRKLQLYIYND